MKTYKNPSILDLLNEIIIIVLNKLPLIQFAQSRLICKRFKHLIDREGKKS